MAKNKKKVLMCPPNFFDIEYEINPWMHQDDQPSDQTAHQQWQKLHDIYTKQLGWQVELITPVKGLPDLFSATGCSIITVGKFRLVTSPSPNGRPKTAQFSPYIKRAIGSE